VVSTPNGTSRTPSCYLQYAGVTGTLEFDPGRWHWANQIRVLHLYSVSKGRSQLLQPRRNLQRPISIKWNGKVLANFNPSWKEIWLSVRLQKEAGFIWSVVHCAIAVNSWKAQINNRIPSLCICYPNQASETVLHRMFMCPRAQYIWKYAFIIMYRSQDIPQVQGRWVALTWQQCIMGSRLPQKFRFARILWLLLRGSAIWIIWIDRNSICFQQDFQSTQKLEIMLWDSVIDHGRTTWLRMKTLIKQYPADEDKFIGRLSEVWCQSELFGRMVADRMVWHHHRPRMGAFDRIY
jgi:hypothetical protein